MKKIKDRVMVIWNNKPYLALFVCEKSFDLVTMSRDFAVTAKSTKFNIASNFDFKIMPSVYDAFLYLHMVIQ